MNLHSAAPDRQTYRENTIASFRRAAAARVSFVEFDVQVGTQSSYTECAGSRSSAASRRLFLR